MATYEIIYTNFRSKIQVEANSFAEAVEKWKALSKFSEASIRSITVI